MSSGLSGPSRFNSNFSCYDSRENGQIFRLLTVFIAASRRHGLS